VALYPSPFFSEAQVMYVSWPKFRTLPSFQIGSFNGCEVHAVNFVLPSSWVWMLEVLSGKLQEQHLEMEDRFPHTHHPSPTHVGKCCKERTTTKSKKLSTVFYKGRAFNILKPHGGTAKEWEQELYTMLPPVLRP